MTKKIVLASMLVFGSSSLLAGVCSDGFKMDFTFFAKADKSYVITQNKFKNMKATFPGDKLEGATVEIDLMSLDTSADLNNGRGGMWPAAMVGLRDRNTLKLFEPFTIDKGKGFAEITKVNADSVDVEITLNGKTKKINMLSKVEGDILKASGKLMISDFSEEGWKSFTRVASGFHKGKSWDTIDVFFYVPASCK